MFQEAHELGLFTVLWCYLRNPAFKTKDVDYHLAADLTGQANHLGVTIEADIIKQKLPETNGGYTAVNFGKTHKAVYSQLSSDNPIDLTRYQLANCYMGRAGLINSGGASAGESDLKDAVKTAVINKRAGGMGLISGRKAFQRPLKEGVGLLNAIQDVYLHAGSDDRVAGWPTEREAQARPGSLSAPRACCETRARPTGSRSGSNARASSPSSSTASSPADPGRRVDDDDRACGRRTSRC